MNKKKVALLTGITGFIGYHLAIRLVSEGWNVHAIIRKTSNIVKIEEKLGRNITFHIYDEENNLSQIMKQVSPSIVFHLASLFLANHKYEDISDLIDSNIKFGTQILDAMIENKIYYFINTGTSWQHYNNEKYNPVNLYAASKQAFEMIIKYYQEITPLKVINLKLFDTYGEEDTRPKILALLRKISETGENLCMSKGEQLIDIVHVDDVVEAFIVAAQYIIDKENLCLETYMVTSGKLIKLHDLVKVYEAIVKKKLNITWGGRPYRNREVMIPWNTGQTLPGWKARVDLVSGITKVLGL